MIGSRISIFHVAPAALEAVLLFIKTCGHVNVPALFATVPLLVIGASCIKLAVLFKTPVAVFVHGEFELKLPPLLTVPELSIPPELVTLPPELGPSIYSWVRRLALQADLQTADRVLRDALLEINMLQKWTGVSKKCENSIG